LPEEAGNWTIGAQDKKGATFKVKLSVDKEEISIDLSYQEEGDGGSSSNSTNRL
jgi:hypothetical protein